MPITINKAIEILTHRAKLLRLHPDPEKLEATQLGIEALKETQKSRGTLRPGLYPLLPGETEE